MEAARYSHISRITLHCMVSYSPSVGVTMSNAHSYSSLGCRPNTRRSRNTRSTENLLSEVTPFQATYLAKGTRKSWGKVTTEPECVIKVTAAPGSRTGGAALLRGISRGVASRTAPCRSNTRSTAPRTTRKAHRGAPAPLLPSPRS